MVWNFRFVLLAQIQFHDSACALVYETVCCTELGREANFHTYVQWKYSVQMTGVVDIGGREQLVYHIALFC